MPRVKKGNAALAVGGYLAILLCAWLLSMLLGVTQWIMVLVVAVVFGTVAGF
jgi:hypothetical protein